MTGVILCTALAAAGPDLSGVEQALEAGELETARVYVDLAVEAHPKSTSLLRLAAEIAARQGDDAGAVAYLERLLELDPRDDFARLQLAQAHWRLGEEQQAQSTLDRVFERHPELPEAMALQRAFETGEAERSPSWTPIVRADVSGGYDSNLALDAEAAPDAQRQGEAGLLSVELAGGASVDTPVGPFSALVRLVNHSALNDYERLSKFAPSWVQAALVQRFEADEWGGGVDARYQYLATNLFQSGQQHQVTPSLWGSYDTGAGGELRLLFGADARLPVGDFGRDNLTLRLGLRDTLQFGDFQLVVDVTGRQNLPTGGVPDGYFYPVDFQEIGGSLYAAYTIADLVQPFVLGGVQGRAFAEREGEGPGNEDPRESTYVATAGVRILLDMFEIHAEYTFVQNLSNPSRTFNRHRAALGVRVWYP